MNFPSFLRLFFIGAGCLLTHPLVALEFRVLSWSGEVDGLKFRNGQAEILIPVGERVVSPVYRLQGVAPLKFYRTITHEGKSIDQTVLILQQPAGMTRGLLLLSPVEGRDDSYTGRWLDDAAETNPAGTLRVYNLARHPLAVKLGAKQMPLAQQATGQFTFDAKARSVPVQVAAYVKGEWNLALSMSQPVRARFRVLMIFRDASVQTEEEPSLIEVVTLYDVPPPVPTAVALR